MLLLLLLLVAANLRLVIDVALREAGRLLGLVHGLVYLGGLRLVLHVHLAVSGGDDGRNDVFLQIRLHAWEGQKFLIRILTRKLFPSDLNLSN